jgi:hypothetical protein
LRPEIFWKPRSLGAVLAKLSSPVDTWDCRQRFINAGAKYAAPNEAAPSESRDTICRVEGSLMRPPSLSSPLTLAGEPKKKPVFLRRRSKRNMSRNITVAAATPPTTPPTILPVACGLSVPDPESELDSEPEDPAPVDSGETPAVLSELSSSPHP